MMNNNNIFSQRKKPVSRSEQKADEIDKERFDQTSQICLFFAF
jgi:hypothetical protein